MTSRTIMKSRRIAAPPERVFDALTVPDRIVDIFPFSGVEVDPREGGTILFRGEAEGKPFIDSGVVEFFRPAELFQYRYWSDNHGTERRPQNDVSLRYVLTRLPDGATQLDVTHSALPSKEYVAAMDAAWDHLLATLASRLEADCG